MNDLKNKVVVITGASSGIGAETARLFAAEGARVVLVARRRERLEALKTELGESALAVACDVTDSSSVDALFAQVKNKWGPVDVLVNNAGVMLLGRLEKGLKDEWRAMEELNVLSVFYASYKAIEQMKAASAGMIVHVSSTAARGPRPMNGAYAASKAAVLAAAESMRQELITDGIRICTIIPGAVATELPEHVTDEEARSTLSGLLKMKRLDPQDVARAIVFAAQQPTHVSINEILIRPTQQPF